MHRIFHACAWRFSWIIQTENPQVPTGTKPNPKPFIQQMEHCEGARPAPTSRFIEEQEIGDFVGLEAK
jgi:hypothetical protein